MRLRLTALEPPPAQVADVQFLQNIVSRCRCSGWTKRSGSVAPVGERAGLTGSTGWERSPEAAIRWHFGESRAALRSLGGGYPVPEMEARDFALGESGSSGWAGKGNFWSETRNSDKLGLKCPKIVRME